MEENEKEEKIKRQRSFVTYVKILLGVLFASVLLQWVVFRIKIDTKLEEKTNRTNQQTTKSLNALQLCSSNGRQKNSQSINLKSPLPAIIRFVYEGSHNEILYYKDQLKATSQPSIVLTDMQLVHVCGLEKVHRDLVLRNVDFSASPRVFVLFLPGNLLFSAKAVLYGELKKKLGSTLVNAICPQSWIPSEGMEAMNEFRSAALDDPTARFILKSSHRQQNIKILSHGGGGGEDENDFAFQTTDEKLRNVRIIQRFYDNFNVTKIANTAFRTYVWLYCTSPDSSVAVVDYNAPAYFGKVIASGYTPLLERPLMSTSLYLKAYDDEMQSIRNHIRWVLKKFLFVFTKQMCFSENASLYKNKNVIVGEIFGFDWLPILEEEEDKTNGRRVISVRLLEANRFPDMQMEGGYPNLKEKDLLKFCTYFNQLNRQFPTSTGFTCLQDFDVISHPRNHTV